MAAYGTMPRTSNYSGYYPFDSDSSDVSGNGNTLTLAATTSYVTARFGTAGLNKTGNGSAAYHYNNIWNNGGAITISAWFLYGSTTGNANVCYLSMSGNKNIYYLIQYVPAINYFFWLRRPYGGGDQGFSLNPITLSTTTWTYVCATYDGSTMDLFLNGKFYTPVAASNTGSLPGFTDKFIIGNDNNLNQSLNGVFDEVIVEKRGWSRHEITNYYNMTKGRLCPQVGTV